MRGSSENKGESFELVIQPCMQSVDKQVLQPVWHNQAYDQPAVWE